MRTGALLLVLLLPIAALAGEGDLVRDVRWLGCYDGDTCTFTLPGVPAALGERVKVRIANIDTPEIKARCPAEERGAIAAREAIVDLLRHAARIDLVLLGRDRYRRILARVLADGRDVGELLIARGLARPWEGHRRSWC
jgi:endonuclease YncB( thermonuclease family)